MGGLSAGSDAFFSVSPAALAKPESFAVRRGDNPERLDARFNHPAYGLWHGRLAAAPVETPALGSLLLSLASGATPKRSDESLYAAAGIRFFRILNVGDGEILEQDLKHITEEVHNGDLERSQLESGDVLLTITGRVGSAAVVREEHLPANINQHIARLRVDRERCRPEFLREWLNCPAGLALSNRPVSGGTRPALDYRAVRNIPIPLPALAEQDRLVAAMDAARAERRDKLAAADELLAGLDDLILDSLGVKRPAEINRRVFAVNQRAIAGRFDARHYALRPRLESSFPIVELRSLVWAEPDYGLSSRAATRKSQDEPRYIRITDFGDDGIAPGHEFATADPIDWDYTLNRDDLLFARTGSVGKTYLHEDVSEPAIFAGYCIRFQFDTAKVSPQFVYWWTKTSAYSRWVAAIQRPSVQANINKEEFKRCPIPLPPLPEQERLVAEIESIRESSRRLRAEAESGWQEAKEWFEGEVLGFH